MLLSLNYIYFIKIYSIYYIFSANVSLLFPTYISFKLCNTVVLFIANTIWMCDFIYIVSCIQDSSLKSFKFCQTCTIIIIDLRRHMHDLDNIVDVIFRILYLQYPSAFFVQVDHSRMHFLIQISVSDRNKATFIDEDK